MPIQAPAAPDLDTILDVEGQVEPRLVAAIHAAGVFDVDGERQNAEQLTPRVETQIHLGACIARTELPAGSTDPRQALPTAWNITVIFHVVTDREKPVQAAAHGKYRAGVRRVAAQFFNRLNPHLPYHKFQKLTEAGTTPNMLNENARHEDISKIMFQGTISVRSTAWST